MSGGGGCGKVRSRKALLKIISFSLSFILTTATYRVFSNLSGTEQMRTEGDYSNCIFVFQKMNGRVK